MQSHNILEGGSLISIGMLSLGYSTPEPNTTWLKEGLPHISTDDFGTEPSAHISTWLKDGYRRTALMTIPHTTVDFIQHLGVIIVASAVPSRMLLVVTVISVFK